MQISSLEGWKLAYDNGACPAELLEQQRLACSDNDPAWISIATEAQLLQQISNLKALEKHVAGSIWLYMVSPLPSKTILTLPAFARPQHAKHLLILPAQMHMWSNNSERQAPLSWVKQTWISSPLAWSELVRRMESYQMSLTRN